MIVSFTGPATRDLTEIANYLRQRSPQGARKVRAAIRNTIALLCEHPNIGREIEFKSVRCFVEPRFGYLVYYRLNSDHDQLQVLRISHPKRERPFGET